MLVFARRKRSVGHLYSTLALITEFRWSLLHTPWSGRPPRGILANQYLALNFEFIFAKNLGIGNPMVAFNFRDILFPVTGIGTWPSDLCFLR
jgi:hypothetical protein